MAGRPEDGGKSALVTGSTSGIGLACARALARRGVNVVITGFGDRTTIDNILGDLRGLGVRADYVSADLSKLTDIDALWSEVIRLYPDGIDILVNNAGLQKWILLEDVPDEVWDLHISVMLSAPFHLTKRCLPSMKKKGWGRIVNMSSVLGVVSMTTCAHYSAAKHGMIGLTKGVALENAQYGITCNAVCPGCTDTPLLTQRMKSQAASGGLSFEQAEANVLATVATGKLILPEQVAELVEFLCLSNASSQMTGAVYLIDHGLSAA